MYTVRVAEPEDLDAVMAIQNRGYAAEYRESSECIEKILKLKKSLVAVDDETKRMIGYVLVHSFSPVNGGIIPTLGDPRDVKEEFDKWFIWIHDLCVLPEARRRGVGKTLVEELLIPYPNSTVRLVSMDQFTNTWWVARRFVSLARPAPDTGYGTASRVMEYAND